MDITSDSRNSSQPSVLAVMGVTGAGKSSFIKLVTGNTSVKVGHSQLSETKVISSYDVQIQDKVFTLVDTPGFDDYDIPDSEILKLLVKWLATTYRTGQKLNGILYLHRITDSRMRGSSLRNLKVFKELIGDTFHKSVTLGTTCWSMVPQSIAIAREAELTSSTTFWKTLISNGARLERIPSSVAEAKDLVYQIASHDPVVLQMQRDIVDLGHDFQDLAIANLVANDLEEEKKRQVAEMKALRIAKLVAREFEQERERIHREELGRIRERNKRIQAFKSKQASCLRLTPSGTCDKPGCYNKLQKWKVTWHCCSCSEYDHFWYCGACGNDCGNSEHPYMSQIDNEDDCVIM